MENESGVHGTLLQQLASRETTARSKKTWPSVQEPFTERGHLNLAFQLLSPTEVTSLL